jgi:DNA relaxase NicK
MLTTGAVDYIGVTFSASFDEHRLEPWFGRWKKAGRGKHGYETLQISELGASLVSDGPERQGKHLDVSGTCWQAMRDEDMATELLPSTLISYGGNATRIDFALDMHDCDSSVDLFYELAHLGQVKTRARGRRKYESTKEYGFYIGSRGSDKFARIYDKRLEQGALAGPRWNRVELQMRKRYAVLMTTAYVSAMNKRAFINRAIQDYVDFPTNDEFQRACREQDGDLPLLHRKPPKFIRWLESQVIPAMLNYQEQHPDADVLRAFSLMYHEAFNRRKR